jgi:hypothetical protein
MWLVQILLPLYDNNGARFSGDLFQSVRSELANAFEGVTVYSRAPAEGLWKGDESSVCRDDLILFEVMAEHLDAAWWQHYRKQLESRFRQRQIVIRAQEMQLL